MKKVINIIIAASICMTLLSSCKDDNDGMDGSFNAVISSNPQNLDPQLANDKESYFVIRNIYATLMDIDSDGRIANGAAESYTVSDDGLKYTFKLRDGIMWYGLSSDEEVSLTAYDYEYAFRRIYSPDTHSPHTERFSAIKNSLAVYEGAVPDNKLGVYAIDKSTLVIELEYPNCDFLKLLTHPAASPCNEELFLSTQGRYGLSAADTYSCGAFYIADWNYDPYWTDNHISLEKISSNSLDGYTTAPRSVNIEITSDRSSYEAENNILIDGYVIDDIEYYNEKLGSEYQCSEYIYAASLLFISPQSPVYGDESARKALFSAVSAENTADCIDENSEQAYGIIPHGITVMNKSFRELYPDIPSSVLAENPKKLWGEFTSQHEDVDFNSYIMLVCDAFQSDTIPHSLIADFEENLDLYCSAVFENKSEFEQKISAGEYDLCINTIYSDYNLSEEYISSFNDYIPDNSILKELISDVRKSKDISTKKDAVKKAEQYIVENAYALPLTYEKKYFVCRNDVNNLWYDPYTDVIFYKYALQE